MADISNLQLLAGTGTYAYWCSKSLKKILQPQGLKSSYLVVKFPRVAASMTKAPRVLRLFPPVIQGLSNVAFVSENDWNKKQQRILLPNWLKKYGRLKYENRRTHLFLELLLPWPSKSKTQVSIHCGYWFQEQETRYIGRKHNIRTSGTQGPNPESPAWLQRLMIADNLPTRTCLTN